MRKGLAIGVFYGVVSLFAVLAPVKLDAQTYGNKATYNSSGVAGPSQVWIDASAFCGTSNGNCAASSDICANVLNAALAEVPPTGGVVDARGVVPATSASGHYTCSTNPFASLMNYPTTLLLPAYTIVTSATWELPNNTRIIGEGQETQLVAANGMSGDLIEMGTSTLCPSGCTSIGVEHLLLSGLNTSSLTAGINNLEAQAGSYVNDVNFYNFSNTGLIVSTSGANSGPYSNITFSTNSTGSAVPKCVDLEAQTLGLHGITCTGNESATYSQGEAAIWVNAGNNSIEDAHLELYWDGIEVGNIPDTAVGNVVISNVTGSHGMINTVHICGNYASDSSAFGTCSITSATVSDVVIMQDSILEPSFHTTVADDTSTTSIEGCRTCEVPLGTGLYTLGHPLGGGYSRFGINPAYPSSSCISYGCNSTYIPTWGVGSDSITSGTSCLVPGAIYSNTSSTSSSNTIFVCSYSGWKPIA